MGKMKHINKAITLLLINLFLFTTAVVVAAADYYPPFELSGVVTSVGEDTLEVHLPYINEHVKVKVSAKTSITNRMERSKTSCRINDISEQDLVVVKGVIQKEVFMSTDISFLPN